MIPPMIVFEAVVAAVAVAIAIVAVVGIIAPPAAAIAHRILDALLEALNAIDQLAGLTRVEAAAGAVVKAALEVIGFMAQAVGGMVADAIAAVEPVDLPLDIVEPDLQLAHLAPIVAAIAVVAVVAAIAVVVAVRLIVAV